MVVFIIIATISIINLNNYFISLNNFVLIVVIIIITLIMWVRIIIIIIISIKIFDKIRNSGI